MSDEAAFLTAIAANPADDLTRLVYADWLDEHDDPRATYLRLVVEVASLSKQGRLHDSLSAQVQPIADNVEESWREAVGKRFSLMLNSFVPEHKLRTIVAVRSPLGLGLPETKALVEMAPFL